MTGERGERALYLAGAAATAAFCAAPVLLMVLTAASGRPDWFGAGGLALTADHFREVLATGTLHFPRLLFNSLVVAGASAALAVAVASPAAYAVARLPLPGRAAFLLAVLAASMFPPVCVVGWLFRLMASLEWINSYRSLILPYAAWVLPLSLWVLTSYFARVPPDLDRAALVDGCGRLSALRRVILPVAAPGIVSTAILSFVFAFNEFMFALILTTDFRARTVPVGIALFEGLHGEIPWGPVMAAATLTTLPVVALALFFQRRIIQGLTRGAVKG